MKQAFRIQVKLTYVNAVGLPMENLVDFSTMKEACKAISVVSDVLGSSLESVHIDAVYGTEQEGV